MIVVSDTSPISNLILIGRLHLLADVYGEILIPPHVWKEINRLAHFGIDLSELRKATWLRIIEPANQELVRQLLDRLDLGEAEALALADELHADYILIDETKGRKVADEIGLRKVGLLGVLLKAKEEGHLPLIRPVLDELREIAGFWIAETLYQDMQRLARE